MRMREYRCIDISIHSNLNRFHIVPIINRFVSIHRYIVATLVSREQRDPIVLQKVRKQVIKFCHDSPKSKETRNKILAQVNTKDSGN